MFDHKTIDDIARRLGDALPDSARKLQQNIEENFRSVLSSTFTKLDLVTREELDIQKAVLARTQEKLDLLTEKITALETELRDSKSV